MFVFLLLLSWIMTFSLTKVMNQNNKNHGKPFDWNANVDLNVWKRKESEMKARYSRNHIEITNIYRMMFFFSWCFAPFHSCFFVRWAHDDKRAKKAFLFNKQNKSSPFNAKGWLFRCILQIETIPFNLNRSDLTIDCCYFRIYFFPLLFSL